MKRSALPIVLAVLLVMGLFSGCSKDQSAADPGKTNETEKTANETKYAYQATYLPLDLSAEQLEWINGFCVDGNRLFLLGSCLVG